MDGPLHIVSVSLGSSRRDKSVEADFLGRRFLIERRGTDGDLPRAAQMIAALDGHAAAIGLGGIDLYLIAGSRRYTVRDAARLAAHARTTPVVDGSGLKNTLERETVRWLQREGLLRASDGSDRRPRVLVVSAVDRFGLAEAIVGTGADTCFGDVIFALQIPFAVRRLGTIRLLAHLLLPIICRLPFRMLYPTGDKQHETHSRAAGGSSGRTSSPATTTTSAGTCPSRALPTALCSPARWSSPTRRPRRMSPSSAASG
jgi:hypothetical protein